VTQNKAKECVAAAVALSQQLDAAEAMPAGAEAVAATKALKKSLQTLAVGQVKVGYQVLWVEFGFELDWIELNFGQIILSFSSWLRLWLLCWERSLFLGLLVLAQPRLI